MAEEPNEDEDIGGSDEGQEPGVTAPAPGVIPGASMLPAAAPEVLEAVAAAVARLRAEFDATDDKARRARLLGEAGEIQERGGDEPGAARDYLAAYNADTSFREPLEGLVRLLERRRSISNLGKLVEALVASAQTPAERARALTQRAAFFEDVQHDLEGARGAAKEATENEADPADVGAAWLTLEMVAAKLGDAAQREEALAGRASLTNDATWKGLLLADCALLASAAGETDRALEIAERARDAGEGATWTAWLATEKILRADLGLPGSDEARTRGRALAEALEARAELLGRPEEEADRLGVPRWCRGTEHVVDLLLRAADMRARSSELGRAATALERALEITTAARGTSNDLAIVDHVTLNAMMRVAEQRGNTALAADLAQKRLDDETEGELDGGGGAALAMRVAEHAASEGDIARALDALSTATKFDPTCAPARALKIDILEGGGDDARFATELEDFAQQLEPKEDGDDARGRTLLLASYVWAARAKDAEKARSALGRAAMAGVPNEVAARMGRSLASLLGDDAWYEDATRALLPLATGTEVVLLQVELARVGLARGDESSVAKAIAALRGSDDGRWLGRVLAGLSSAGTDDESKRSARAAIDELAADAADPALRRSLVTVSAMRAADDAPTVVEQLKSLAADNPADPLIATWLGDLLRKSGARVEAARVALALAEATGEDLELRAARQLEAGFEIWRGGDRTGAIPSFEAAAEAAPEAARTVIAWAARGVEVDAVEGRRRALDLAGGDAGVALERFALEASMGDPDDAANALTSVDIASSASLRLAGALARLVWTRGATDKDAVSAALDVVAASGEKAREAAAAERHRLTREGIIGDGPEDVADAAKAWLDVGASGAAAIEWLAAAMATGDVAREVPARRALAELLSDEAKEAMSASATLLDATLAPEGTFPLVDGSSHAVRLANLELGPPGCDPRRRASVLREIDGALGEAAELDALALAAWSLVTAGEATTALECFRKIVTARPDDLAAWEGVRTAAEALKDHETYALACENLGMRCASDSRGAAFWEQAALAWTRLGGKFDERIEAALDSSFARDATRQVTFDRLFRRVRDRKDLDKTLAVAMRRLEHTDEPSEIAKLYWEIARALREKGDPDSALEALGHVFEFDENHVGALALTGEIFIRRGMFAEAAEHLAKLARIPDAPPKNRVTAGVAAVDLYENKLGRHDAALVVLVALHEARLSTLPVRERLARAAARTGSWREATRILEELMHERSEREGRMEAARLAMAIHRDRLLAPENAIQAVTKLLDESPTDGEAIDLVLTLEPEVPARARLLERCRDALLMSLHEAPGDLDNQRRLARIAHVMEDATLEHSALAGALALGGPDGSTEQMIALIASKKPRVPQVTINEAMIRQILAPGDDGPVADLFALLGPTLAAALGPTKETLGVTKKDRVDPRSGLALRNEIATWAGCFGIREFELYVGGKDPGGVQGIPGETPALVVGSSVNAPLSPATRGRVARELLGIVRGTTITRWRDDQSINAIVVAACNLVKVRVEHPPLAVLAEMERLIGKALGRKTKAAIEPVCRAWVQSGQDVVAWPARARVSHGRVAALASGDIAVVLSDVFGEAVEHLGAIARDDLRAHELLRFALSRPYFDLRRALGLEG